MDDSERQQFQGVTLADENFDQFGETELLLGADARRDIVRAGILRGDNGNLYGELTAFGWTVAGMAIARRPCNELTYPAHLNSVESNQTNVRKRKSNGEFLDEVMSKNLRMLDM